MEAAKAGDKVIKFAHGLFLCVGLLLVSIVLLDNQSIDAKIKVLEDQLKESKQIESRTRRDADAAQFSSIEDTLRRMIAEEANKTLHNRVQHFLKSSVEDGQFCSLVDQKCIQKEVAPQIQIAKKMIYANIGTTITFPFCRVISTPPAEARWRKAYGALSAKRVTTRGGTFKIRDVVPTDTGAYICEAGNYLGNASVTFTLLVRPLQFLETPSNIVYMNAYDELYCSAEGTGENMEAYWTKNNVRVAVQTEERVNDTIGSRARVNETSTYTCTIRDGLAVISKSVQVTVFTLPSKIFTVPKVSMRAVARLGEYLRAVRELGEFALCWRGSRDGYNWTTFRKRCHNLPNTMALAKTKEGIFGAFTNVAWTEPPKGYINTFKWSRRSFLFSQMAFETKDRLNLFNVSRPSSAVQHSRREPILWGQNEFTTLDSSRFPNYGDRMLTFQPHQDYKPKRRKIYSRMEEFEFFYNVFTWPVQ